MIINDSYDEIPYHKEILPKERIMGQINATEKLENVCYTPRIFFFVDQAKKSQKKEKVVYLNLQKIAQKEKRHCLHIAHPP